jgi:4-amino-4-deoxy-L-arabinose transferase-like glycosyltransferase
MTTRQQIWIAFAAALLIRLAYVGWYPQFANLCPDCEVYDRVAKSLGAGMGLAGGTAEDTSFGQIPNVGSVPEIGIGPVYPVFLQGVYWVAGHRLGAVRIVQAVLGAMIVPLIWHISSQAFGLSAGRLCGWLVALSPPLIAYSGLVLTENLSAMLLVLSAWLLMTAIARRSVWRFAVSGASLAVLILLREEMVVLLPALAGIAAWKGRPRPGVRHLVAYTMTAVLAVGAYSLRNYLVVGKPILVTAHGGETLWISAKGWTEWHFDDPELQRLTLGLSYVERNEVLQRDALRMIKADPARYLWLCVKRVPALWLSSHTTYMRGLSDRYAVYVERGNSVVLGVKSALLAVHLAMLTLAAAGGWMAWRAPVRPLALWMITAPIVAITCVHFFLFSAPRYQIPVLPFALAFAALPVVGRGGHENYRTP